VVDQQVVAATHAQRLERYAELTVRFGANVQPGQDVLVQSEIDQLELTRLVVDRCYAAGARRVETIYVDEQLRRAAVAHGAAEGLRSTYRYELEMIAELRERGAAVIFLTSVGDPDVFAGMDPSLVTARHGEYWSALNDALGRGEIAWTMAVAPSVTWAQRIFGEPDLDRLWDAVATAMRLDDPDPAESWLTRLAELTRRRDQLNELQLTTVHVRGPGTDLTIPLADGALWVAGGVTSPQGVVFQPNVPTEEVFTSPDWRRATGTVRVTAPVIVSAGESVNGLELTLDAGRITDVRAESGRELVLAELEQDAQAPYLGEVALVDSATSGVARAGVVFQHPLLDENVSSHIAWGAAYEETVPALIGADESVRLAAGLNVSAFHTDVPIGGAEVQIDGLTADGARIPLIRGPDWTLTAK
jgi:aminopeptidase